MKTQNQKYLEKELLKQLGIDDKKTLKHWEKEPYLMDNDTVLKFWNYVKKAPAIMIVGDYDVDGVCASYIMSKSIRHVYPKKPITIRIPKRMSEGYGFNKKIADEIREKLPRDGLVITVDNGIAAANALEELKQDGYKVIVTDHHEVGKNKIPEVDMVLDPKMETKEQIFQGNYWCGAAVAYKIAESMISEELGKELECFAAIATIGDCMQLREGNWGIVKRGMKTIKERKAPQSILGLLEKLKQNPENLVETSLSFYLCPAINAPGRLLDDGAKKPLSYFLSPSEEKCNELVELNEQRKALRDEQLEQVKAIIKEEGLENDCPIWVKAPGLHEGIVGILAGNLAEEYGVPVIVLTESHTQGIIKGSARSAGNIDIFKYLQNCGDIFTGFGGHEGAAGLSMPEENLKIARRNQIMKPVISDYAQNILMSIMENEIPDMAEISEVFRPFGEGNQPPKFQIDVNLANEVNKRMLGTPPVHLCITDPLKQYKVMHFYHEPNNLRDKNIFNLTGEIKYDIYKNNKTAILFADKMDEPEIDEKER